MYPKAMCSVFTVQLFVFLEKITVTVISSELENKMYFVTIYQESGEIFNWATFIALAVLLTVRSKYQILFFKKTSNLTILFLEYSLDYVQSVFLSHAIPGFCFSHMTIQYTTFTKHIIKSHIQIYFLIQPTILLFYFQTDTKSSFKKWQNIKLSASKIRTFDF